MDFPSDLAFTREDLHGTVVEPAYGGATSFLRRRYSRDFEGVDVAVTGIPYDLATTNRPGARLGPRAIRVASAGLAWEEAVDGWGFSPVDRLAVVDAGDCAFDPGRPGEVPGAIYEHARAILATDTAVLALGGDHFVSYPLLRAHAEHHGPLALVHFDAHSDTWADEAGRIDHGTMFWHAAREGLVEPGRSVQVGLRTHNPESHGFNLFPARRVHGEGIDAVVSAIHDAVGDRPCYLTFDIDCLDPAFAPGTGTPVAGGLSSWQALAILRGLGGLNLVGMDVVEVAPPYDVSEITALAAATLAVNMLCIYAQRPAG